MPIWETPAPVKAMFFDADGTLLSFKTHRVPETATMALTELRRKGIKCFLATGRPPYQLDEVSIDNLEAFITFNGQLCFSRDEVYADECMDPADIATVVDQVHQGLYNALFMEKGRCYVSGHDDYVRAVEDIAGLSLPEGDIDQALHNDIYQLNIYATPGNTEVVTSACKNVKLTRWNENFVDVFPRLGGKHVAVRKTLDHYGICPEEAVAFGDGGNDLTMFGVVGTAVAMGNGNEDVKEQADYVTDSVDRNGIYNACVRLGLL